MRVVKLYQKPNKPEYLKLVRFENGEMLVNYPIDKPNHLRQARWFAPNEVYIEWIKTFKGE
jgi:hypothetical protein